MLEAPAWAGRSQTATSSIWLAKAVEVARVSRNSPRAMGLSRTVHSSRQLFQARSRALLIVQVAIRLVTAARWRSTASSAAFSNDCRMDCSAASSSWSTFW